ncbi:uncharacterized protein EDB91DRAFT_1056617 [Suillus paluster]|uniref:uncharacterized protein n=1 Tax=Suillus paluster TaxID=48578 RepID=UPI001B869ABE|nr:uncharacterized protein EDB91DRAFT_1056617 [Suillus paluster]KAG1734950.1 hypothetical protein EDB91DRAFT_1056617 [Suillus paluster]
MLVFALQYQEPIDRITSDKSLKRAKKYELDDDEWKIVADLVAVLSKATLFFSQDSATITAVILAMDKLNNKLNQQMKEPYHSAVISAMQLAKNKMDRYWKITDLSNVYRIAMVLHPGLKLECFCEHSWQKEWIDTAEKLVRKEFTDKYEKSVETTDDTAADVVRMQHLIIH